MTYTKKLISGYAQSLSSTCQEVTIYYKNMIVEAFIQRIHTFFIHSVRNILENIIQYLFKRPSCILKAFFYYRQYTATQNNQDIKQIVKVYYCPLVCFDVSLWPATISTLFNPVFISYFI